MASVAPGIPAGAHSAIERARLLPKRAYAAAFALGALLGVIGSNPTIRAAALALLALALFSSAIDVLATRRGLATSRPRSVDRLAVTKAVVKHARTHINSYAAARDKRAVELATGGVVAFRVCNGVAVTTGDPLDNPATLGHSIVEFARLRKGRAVIPCFFQVDSALRAAYRSVGMRLVKFGEEAIVDLSTFTLATPARANVRREVGRAHRAGLTVTVMPWTAITPSLTEELHQVSRDWLRGRGGEMGFSMGRLDETVDNGAWLTITRGSDGTIHAFSSWLRMGEDGLALDMVRRRSDAGPGAVDLCLAATLEEAQRKGLSRASLGSVPFRDSLGDAPDGRLTRWIRRRLHASRMHGYCYGSLAAFKQKFAPVWVSRDVAFPRGAALLVLLALIRVHMTQGR